MTTQQQKEFEEILKNFKKVFYDDSPDSQGVAIEYWDVIEAMKAAYNLALDKAAEQVNTGIIVTSCRDIFACGCLGFCERPIISVNKNSILKLKIE